MITWYESINSFSESIGIGEKHQDNQHVLLGNSSSMDQVMVGASEALSVVSQNTRSRLQTIFAIDFAGTILVLVQVLTFVPMHLQICTHARGTRNNHASARPYINAPDFAYAYSAALFLQPRARLRRT